MSLILQIERLILVDIRMPNQFPVACVDHPLHITIVSSNKRIDQSRLTSDTYRRSPAESRADRKSKEWAQVTLCCLQECRSLNAAVWGVAFSGLRLVRGNSVKAPNRPNFLLCFD